MTLPAPSISTSVTPRRPARCPSPSPDFAKLVLFINASLPTAILLFDAYNHHLGPNPVNNALHITGVIAVVCLVLSLTITPARKLSNYNFLSHFRRSLGLFAFYYACLHFFIYLVWDRQLSLANTIPDLLYSKRNLVGFISLLLMLPLALTSTNNSIKRLGSAKWKRLHQLAYPSAILAVLHYFWAFKTPRPLPLTFAAILFILFAYRLLPTPKKSPPRPIPQP